MVEKRVEMELYPFDDLWGGLSFVDKETSGVVCQQVGTNYLRGHINVNRWGQTTPEVILMGHINVQQIATHLLAGVSPREMQSSRL